MAEALKCTISEAEEIFNNYHYKLYPKVTKFREEQVVPKALANGSIHMGMGATLSTDDVSKDERTLVNSCSQFWSILTLITISKLHQEIDRAGLQDHIKITATIYDSIYFELIDDIEVVKWLNDTLIPIMTKSFIVDQKVPNLADLEISRTSWADLTLVPNNSSLEEITTILKSI